jgi:putative FmdB family regulatory protein
MPTYVYECKSCQNSFEVEQRITEAPLTDCVCGGTVRRVIQPVGIAFKGSGFYVNDSVSAPAPKTESKPTGEKAETPAASPAAETKTESS